MSLKNLTGTANSLLSEGKGLLAIDESNSTCNKRFAKFGIAQTEEMRRSYRELILTTPGLNEFVSGVILYDETFRQSTKNGIPFIDIIAQAGILLGIKVDIGAKPLANHPNEKITEGLDGLRKRLREYFEMGARFAKWRAVFLIEKNSPSRACIEANANALALYASLCQEAGFLPIIEPEVMMTGAHSLQRCSEITESVLRSVFNQLVIQGVKLEGLILKTNMILSGWSCQRQEPIEVVANETIKTLLRVVPAAVPGVAFLSGGQSSQLATTRLNAMNKQFKSKLPWTLTFSFARAIQEPAIKIWGGYVCHVAEAQAALLYQVKCDGAAQCGQFSTLVEQPNSLRSTEISIS